MYCTIQRRKSLIAIIGIFSLTVGFQRPEWRRFKSTEENFTVSLPREPHQERTEGRGPLGNGHHIYSLEDNGISYVVSYSSFDSPPPSAKDAKRVLDLARELVLTVTNGKMISEKEIALDGFPGREVRIGKGQLLWILRAYIVRERIYQLMTTQAKAKTESPDTVKFYDSFKLLNPPE